MNQLRGSQYIDCIAKHKSMVEAAEARLVDSQYSKALMQLQDCRE